MTEKLEAELFAFLSRKYVQRCDERQREMGLQYTTAETHDLAKELARFWNTRSSPDALMGAPSVQTSPSDGDATLEEAIDALDKLVTAERVYRSAHDQFGDGDMTTGRAWDQMRAASTAAHALLSRLRALKSKPAEKADDGAHEAAVEVSRMGE